MLLAALLLGQAVGAPTTIPRAELDRLSSRALGIRLLGDAGKSVRHHQFCALIPGTFCFGGRAGDQIVLTTDFEKTAVPGLCAARRYRVGSHAVSETDILVGNAAPRPWPWYRIAERCDRLIPEDDGPYTGFAAGGYGELQGIEAVRFVLMTAKAARARMAAKALPVDCKAERYRSTGICNDPAALLVDGKLVGMRSASIKPATAEKGAHVTLQLWSNAPGQRLAPTYVDLFLDRLPTRALPKATVTRVVMREYDFVD